MKERGLKKMLTGVVLSNKMDKTVVVEIKEKIKHKDYDKYINKYTKYKAHDANNQCQIGDVVTIESSKPISKEKMWAVKNIDKKTI